MADKTKSAEKTRSAEKSKNGGQTKNATNGGKAEHQQVRAKNADKEAVKYIEKFGDKLSKTTTRYGRWINSPGEHEDHPGESLVTRNHDVIKQWAEKRDAKPATVPGTEHDNHLGVLRFDFPGYGGDKLEEVSWDQWLETFDARNLAFIFQEHTKDGNDSNFFQFDNPTREDA